MNIQKLFFLSKTFRIPLAIIVGIVSYIILSFLNFSTPAIGIIFIAIFLGSYQLIHETFSALWNRQFALDYIAILAIIVSIVAKEYLVAAILALMISSGRTLEEYGVSQAKKSLSELADRIPNEVILWLSGHIGEKVKIGEVKVGSEIFIRKGEVIPLDGDLISNAAVIDESSLTGEPYFVEKVSGDYIRSGTINMGEPIIVKVQKSQKDSTYKKIIDLVQQAQNEKSPLVRLADKYSTFFTLITLAISLFAFYYSNGNLMTVLAVLTVATPCPLIIATPIALLGGVNASAKKRIIIKKIASLEVLSRVNTIIFDKTGTITLGKPIISKLELITKDYSKEKILSLAHAIERNSLHPLAKAIVEYAEEQKVSKIHATNIQEKIGEGISGKINNKTYMLSKLPDDRGMAIQLTQGAKKLAVFYFEDEIKEDSKKIIKNLKQKGLSLYIFTGDKKESAEKLLSKLGEEVEIKAGLTPEEKQKGVHQLKNQGKITAMIGDGINDAPALASADVGLVFSNEEQTAASEAADVVFLSGKFSQVIDAYDVSRRTIKIAMESILWGIGISIGAMILASVGLIPPIVGAGLQEVIDVAVIINALRASR